MIVMIVMILYQTIALINRMENTPRDLRFFLYRYRSRVPASPVHSIAVLHESGKEDFNYRVLFFFGEPKDLPNDRNSDSDNNNASNRPPLLDPLSPVLNLDLTDLPLRAINFGYSSLLL